MEPIKDFDKVEAKGMDDFRGLPIGAYECVIKDARINHNEQSGKDTFKVSVDIARGEYKDYVIAVDDRMLKNFKRINPSTFLFF